MVTVHKLGGDSEFIGTFPADQKNTKNIEFFGGAGEDDPEYHEVSEKCDPECDCTDDGLEEDDEEEEEEEDDDGLEEDEGEEEDSKQPPNQPAQDGGAGGPNIVNLLSKDPLFMVLTQFLKNKNGNNIVEALDNINRNLERLNINLELSEKKARKKSSS